MGCGEAVADLQDGSPYDVEAVMQEQIVYFRHGSGRGVFHRDHAEAAAAGFDCLEDVRETGIKLHLSIWQQRFGSLVRKRAEYAGTGDLGDRGRRAGL